MLPFLLLILFTSQLSSFCVSFVNGITNPITKPIISLCLGDTHGCVVFDTYRMKCWGKGSSSGTITNFGQSRFELGNKLPYFNPGTSLSIKKVACLAESTCVLLNTGDIKCVGYNQYGQLGIGISNSPILSQYFVGDILPIAKLGTDVTVTNVAGGAFHVCIITSDTRVKCFGRNINGELGYGDTVDRGKSLSEVGDNLTYIDFGTDVVISSLVIGACSYHSCVILSAPASASQRIKCWGRNAGYQLGYGDTNNRGDGPYEMGDNLTLVDLGTESRVKQLSIGSYFNCAVLVNDILKCWGFGTSGQLGSGSTSSISATGDSMPSVKIDTGRTISLITTGLAHTCIVYDGLVDMKCFGYNDNGQLGQGNKKDLGGTPTTMIPSIPVINFGTGSLQIKSILAGTLFNCVVFIDYKVKCWGRGLFAETLVFITNAGSFPGVMNNLDYFADFLGPTNAPTKTPTKSPSNSPTLPTRTPTLNPTKSPTTPTRAPTLNPTTNPTNSPTNTPTANPTNAPTSNPTNAPSVSPTKKPTSNPSNTPSHLPTKNPIVSPTRSPTVKPSKVPTNKPTRNPSLNPSISPTEHPSASPTKLCDYQSAKICKYDYKCMWKSVDGKRRCIVFDCTELNQGKCFKQRNRCKWNKKDLSCKLK